MHSDPKIRQIYMNVEETGNYAHLNSDHRLMIHLPIVFLLYIMSIHAIYCLMISLLIAIFWFESMCCYMY